MIAGSLSSMPGSPMGQTRERIVSSGIPISRKRFSNRARLVALPMRPT